MRSARVELVGIDLSPPEDFIVRVANESFKVCRATVHVQEHNASIAMFWRADGHPTAIAFDALADAIKRENPGAIAVIVRGSAEGAMTLSSTQQNEWQRFAAAAVGTVARFSWAWDDSSSIAIEIDGEQLTMDAKYDGEAWDVVEVIAPGV